MVSIKKTFVSLDLINSFQQLDGFPALAVFPEKFICFHIVQLVCGKMQEIILHVSLLCTKHFTISFHEITRSGRPNK